MARASAFALAACLLCLLNLTLAAPSDSQQVQWETEAEAEAEEERAGQEAVQAEEAVEADEVEGDADFSSLLQNEQRAGTEDDEPAGEQQEEDKPEQEQQQQQQRVWKPKDEGTLGRLSQSNSTAKEQDVEQEQRNQNPRQDDFGLVGRQQPQGGQFPGQGGQGQFPGYGGQGQGQRIPQQGYTQLSNFGHFKVHTTPRSWMEALLVCAAEGGRLAVPASAEEATAVGQLYRSNKARVGKTQDKELFFIGAHDLIKQGDFTTIIGTKFRTGQYYRWQKGEPNNHGKVEHCVLSNDQGLYWDGNCQKKFAFVCEFKDPCKGVPRGNLFQPQPGQQGPQLPQIPAPGDYERPNQQGQWSQQPQQPQQQQQGQWQQLRQQQQPGMQQHQWG